MPNMPRPLEKGRLGVSTIWCCSFGQCKFRCDAMGESYDTKPILFTILLEVTIQSLVIKNDQ